MVAFQRLDSSQFSLCTYLTIGESALSHFLFASIIFSGIRILTGAPLLALAKKQGVVPPDWDGIRKLFYYNPGLNSDWLDQTLKSGFAGSRYCVYPPGSRNEQLRKIHRFGYVKFKKLQFSKDKS